MKRKHSLILVIPYIRHAKLPGFVKALRKTLIEIIVKKPIIYIDTSVIGGIYDEEFAIHSKHFFDRAKAREFKIVISNIVRDELNGAPEQVSLFYKSLPEDVYKTKN